MPANASFEPSPAIVDTALRLTAVALLLRPTGPWFIRPVVLALAALALISPRVLRSPAAWLAIAGCIAVRIADDWPLADNHIYLLAYWCLALAIALRSAAGVALAWQSRALIGLAFAFAVLWKGVLSPDYLDGRFFRVTLLTDPRFGDAAMLIGGLTESELAANRLALDPLPEGAELVEPPRVTEPARFRALAHGATWGTLLLEAVVAASALWAAAAPSAIAGRVAHAALLVFCLTTYAFAPVAGFGWLLLVMGLAQCHHDQRLLPRVYVAAFLLVLFYSEVPWTGLVLDLFRG